ncbi:TfoX/Sxy family protein [Nitrospina watsonii]|uniref:TfoX_N domain-containing protein n=1 Tax=Nitrospina watsonii TaxID=1323948 RepID=A0ABN8VZI7_9BACT|nr:TfoX/Sxy family protein [Nitrospina watsonii]CAI2717899.1 TfoX_N domain-containing protein [Nitrospina watsonii]
MMEPADASIDPIQSSYFELHMENPSYIDFVLEQLQGLGPVRGRAMFGGHGLYRDDVFFGIVYEGVLYLNTDEASRPQYTEQGMQPFQPRRGQTLKSYYEVPTEVLENADTLVEWAGKAVRVPDRKK